MATGAEQIQAEIERTRAELADTLDTLVDRVSPKRVAGRGADKVKHAVSEAVESVKGESSRSDGDGVTYGRSIRWERIAAAGAVVVVVALVLIKRRRS